MIALADACRLAVLGLAVASAALSALAQEPRQPTEPASQPEPRDSRAASKPDDARAPSKLACLNAAETREIVKSRHFIEPFAALKFAAAQRKAEALSAKLCHAGDEFVYEITMLHHDGRLVHIQMEAATGKLIPRPPHEQREREPSPAAAPKN